MFETYIYLYVIIFNAVGSGARCNARVLARIFHKKELYSHTRDDLYFHNRNLHFHKKDPYLHTWGENHVLVCSVTCFSGARRNARVLARVTLSNMGSFA